MLWVKDQKEYKLFLLNEFARPWKVEGQHFLNSSTIILYIELLKTYQKKFKSIMYEEILNY